MTKEISFTPTEKYPGLLQSHEWGDNTLKCYSDNDAVLIVQVIDDAILRVRYATEGYFERDFSYAIDETYQGNVTSAEIEETSDALLVKTPKVHLYIGKERLQLKFTDPSGKVIR